MPSANRLENVDHIAAQNQVGRRLLQQVCVCDLHCLRTLSWHVYVFSFRLIELGKLQIKTELRDKREYMLNSAIRKVKNKSGVMETRVFTCSECSEEYCMNRNCLDYNYDLYSRVVPLLTQSNIANVEITTGKSGSKPDRVKRKIKASKPEKRKSKKRQNSPKKKENK